VHIRYAQAVVEHERAGGFHLGNQTMNITATDIATYLKCRHRSVLDHAARAGSLERIHVTDAFSDLVRERGIRHEQAFVVHLRSLGLTIEEVAGVGVTEALIADTMRHMRSGVDVIVQGALRDHEVVGRIDVLRRVPGASQLGPWAYEPIDAKLAQESSAASVLQLCAYAELLDRVQGRPPEMLGIVTPWSDFEPQRFRYSDVAAYYRRVKQQLLASFEERAALESSYPLPNIHCDACSWYPRCDRQWRKDDHLCLVAGIRHDQVVELAGRNITSAKQFSAQPLPLAWKPERGSVANLTRVREQARIQVEAREAVALRFEMLPVEPGFGLARLPEPSPGDVFFDLESDPFAGEYGLEYLFGYQFLRAGHPEYVAHWALDRESEKHAFQTFVDFLTLRWKEYPAFHVYHYAPYEPAALKRLMGRYATREEEIDELLRAGVFVDLYAVVRHALRASVESYSLKRLEPFYGFQRSVPLNEANASLATLHALIELERAPQIPDGIHNVVGGYNHDDCRSTAALRDWLELLRTHTIAEGIDIPRPLPKKDGAPNEQISNWILRITPVVDGLLAGIPADSAARTPDQQARWILAHLIDWHRREQKATWWEYFRLADLSAEDLLDERKGLAGLEFLGSIGGTALAPIHRYRFRPQDSDVRRGDKLKDVGGVELGTVHDISHDALVVDIKRRKDHANRHPLAVFAHDVIKSHVIAEALLRIGEHVRRVGFDSGEHYVAATDLLLRQKPRFGNEPLRRDGESALDATIRLAHRIGVGVLPVQGPPGAGKTYTGARFICELIRCGKKVGITAQSHKVIRNLIVAVLKQAQELDIRLSCCHKVTEVDEPLEGLTFTLANEELDAVVQQPRTVGAGTAWYWARPEAAESIDVLVVDEAAQMSLANVVAISQSARAVVLLGDPQQLDQPLQGTHPEGCEVSALQHLLAGAATVAADRGIFLEETWRLHPRICQMTSELFYANKLQSRAGLEHQRVNSNGPLSGAGLRFLWIDHRGNQSSSIEEARAIAGLVESTLSSGSTWVDQSGKERLLRLEDFLIITPYNAQAHAIRQLLPTAYVGTVDKFQGQEAPIAIYSVATSSHADAPRGMEFLYSLKRFNVATSRAKGLCVLVASPQILDAECATPRHMQLVNAFCRFVEIADPVIGPLSQQ